MPACRSAPAASPGYDEAAPEIGYWLGVKYWDHGYGTEAVRALIDFAFTELEHDSLSAGARVTNPASRRILEKCGFQWTGVGLCRIRALNSSAPIDRFRLDRGLWTVAAPLERCQTSVLTQRIDDASGRVARPAPRHWRVEIFPLFRGMNRNALARCLPDARVGGYLVNWGK